ncbi:MAG: hypothetical protein F6K55_24060 [Moorea sp. SIO4A3]|nr:hypothetical protein [Moorena sp. SIO4A3]
MADPVKRLHYFNKQFLREQDFIDEQNYHMHQQRDHNRLLHTPGIAQGLEIPDPPSGSTSVTVNAGIAYDNQGREIFLANNQEINLGTFAADQSVYVAIAYAEQETDPSSEAGLTGNTRWTEEPAIETLEPNTNGQFPADPEEKIILAKVNRSGNEIANIDRSERRSAGVVGGDLEVRSLTLTNPTVDSSQWSSLNLSAAQQVELDGSLSIDRNLNVTGTIAGNLADGIVGTTELANNSVTNAKIANNAVNAAKIQNGTVGNAELANNAVNNAKIANNTINKSKFDASTRNQLDAAIPNTGGNITGNLTVNSSNGVAALQGTASGGSEDLYSGYFTATNTGNQQAFGVFGQVTSNGNGNKYGLYGNAIGGTTGSRFGVYGNASGGVTQYGGHFQAVNTNNGTAYGVQGEVEGDENGTKYGLYGRATGGTAGSRYGVYGYASGGVNKYGGWFQAVNTNNRTAYGVFGTVEGNENGTKYGFYGRATGGTTGSRYGVYGYANSNGTNSKYGIRGFASGNEGNKYGVYGSASGSGTNYAGYFSGNVRVTGNLTTGTITKPSGSFLIDHPLAPLNKTLRHNFVESPEDLCLYRGKVKLNAEGSATVKMPDYFAALTKEEEATVNLTPIGKKPFLVSYQWSPDYTEFELFGEANAEVAYLVLANRDDPAIHQFRKPVEEEKGNGNFEQGKLLYPEAYGYPKEMGVDYLEEELERQSRNLVSLEKC